MPRDMSYGYPGANRYAGGMLLRSAMYGPRANYRAGQGAYSGGFRKTAIQTSVNS